MKDSESRIYREALESVAGQVVLVPPEELEIIAFPFWQKAIHDILVSNRCCQCVCHDHNTAKCFINMIPERQIGLYSGGELSFEGFVETLIGIEQLFLVGSLSSSI